jgi:hypothetical protein
MISSQYDYDNVRPVVHDDAGVKAAQGLAHFHLGIVLEFHDHHVGDDLFIVHNEDLEDVSVDAARGEVVLLHEFEERFSRDAPCARIGQVIAGETAGVDPFDHSLLADSANPADLGSREDLLGFPQSCTGSHPKPLRTFPII